MVASFGEGNKIQTLNVTFDEIKSEGEILTLSNMHAPVFQEGRSDITFGALHRDLSKNFGGAVKSAA